MFTYELKQDFKKIAVVLKGDMDIDVTEIIADEVAPQLMACEQVEIDFSQVPFMDSSGIGLLIMLINDLKERDIEVAIVNIQEDVKQVFSLLQLPEILGRDVCGDF
ncbi:STAS domain-containing protein [Paenibacillus sp. sgz302251]|uniref:STAS domain-containing protein n=1 Tax=Paenibacillus sp. sgz302251 TaxID=3414493 RepID=UPI003C7EA5B1